MNKWIRWQGVIAFAAVAAVLAGFWLLFLDKIVETVIEKTGMAIVGAEVDVKADMKLFPLGLTLRELQVTNPEAPGTNSVECGRIALTFDTLNLLTSRIIINEMAVEGMRFDTKRRHPGTVKKREEKKPEEKERSLLVSPEMPDPKKILAGENLESGTVIGNAKNELQKKEADWQKRIEELPNKATVEAYRSRIEKIRKSSKGDVFGMAGQLAEVRALTRDIEQDIDRVRSAKNAFTIDLSSAQKTLDRAQRAPGDDARRITEKYSISTAGLQNMTQMLFGDKINAWVKSGLLWYDRLQPVIGHVKTQKKDVTVVKPLRAKGVDVRFKEYRPLPDFLIERTGVSAETTAGLLAGTIRNITPDQQILRQPLTFAFSGQKLEAAQAITINGTLNHVDPAKPEDTARAFVKAFKVKELVLSSSKDLPIALRDGVIDLDLKGTFTQALRATITAHVGSARMHVGGEASRNLLVAGVRSALSKVSKFSLTAEVRGGLEDYKMRISSDLDKVLKNAVSSVVAEQGAKLETQLKAAIQEKTGVQLKDLHESYKGLSEQGLKMDSIQNQLNSVLQEALKSSGGGRFRLP